MPALKILVIPGSIRTGSINARLAAAPSRNWRCSMSMSR
jgi:NAD(P)H-dependent FMN reductase